ncbi:UPF0149 family protein [Sphingomonas immobilis]|uniref:UPF0149 family protein n=1 Tax=Sphingomonas immobilis TaxID=3063997 RepID=A0ABT8ZW07_9SPHN|nr:UPF0149 family protein [Sphingomonas sp. CA1-15]MDO7841754.1 UPF0149 family protein [Sphingomonas sp. CA1-15]
MIARLAMKKIPSRFRRLDGALADLPLDEPMLLTELDGFLTGVLVGPEPVAPDEWMQLVWGIDNGTPPFEDPLDVQWFADAVMARYNEILRDLERGKPQPIFDIDERNGDVLWEPWIDGFTDAVALRPDDWAAWAENADPVTAQALSGLSSLIAIARNESDLDSVQINAMQSQAPKDIGDCILRLHAARARDDVSAAAPSKAVIPAKVGRNDSCPCGSGKKYKRCCA